MGALTLRAETSWPDLASSLAYLPQLQQSALHHPVRRLGAVRPHLRSCLRGGVARLPSCSSKSPDVSCPWQHSQGPQVHKLNNSEGSSLPRLESCSAFAIPLSIA